MTMNTHYHVNKRDDWGVKAGYLHELGSDIIFLRMGKQCLDTVIPDISMYITESQANAIVDALLALLITTCGDERCDVCAPSEEVNMHKQQTQEGK